MILVSQQGYSFMATRGDNVIEVGEIFNNLELISNGSRAKGNERLSKWRCFCGNVFEKPRGYVESGDTRSCGCIRNKAGKQYNNWTVIHKTDKHDTCQNPIYLCSCECSYNDNFTIVQLKINSPICKGCSKEYIIDKTIDNFYVLKETDKRRFGI